MKKIFAALTAAVLAVTLSGCTATVQNAMKDYNFAEMNTDFIQLRSPEEGDTIAIVDTDLGEFRMVIYEDYAPNTSAAFIEKAKSGEYDNKPVYGVMKDVYFLTGGEENEKGTYIGRTGSDGLIANEYSVDLWPFKGALMSFSEKSGYGDARWFVCNTDKDSLTEEAVNELKKSAADREDPVERDNLTALFDKFYEVGGVFGLSGTVTVFGQTYEGMDVVEQLCNIPTESNGRASEDVMIKSVTISEYSAEE